MRIRSSMKPLILAIIIGLSVIVSMAIIFLLILPELDKKESNVTTKIVNTEDTKKEDKKKNEFNAKFEKYKGDEVKGSSVKSLISVVNTYNESQEESEKRIISVEGETLNTINNESIYKVELEYSDDGYVEKVIIKEVEDNNKIPELVINTNTTNDNILVQNTMSENTVIQNTNTVAQNVVYTNTVNTNNIYDNTNSFINNDINNNTNTYTNTNTVNPEATDNNSQGVGSSEIERFNSELKQYEGYYTGSQLPQLIQILQGKGIQIEALISEAYPEKYYLVSFEYDFQGYIYKCIIKE